MGGCVSFPSMKQADISKMVEAIYTSLKKIVTISGVLGDLINYHSLHSPYDTQLGGGWVCWIPCCAFEN